jgi:hypothetical protein
MSARGVHWERGEVGHAWSRGGVRRARGTAGSKQPSPHRHKLHEDRISRLGEVYERLAIGVPERPAH